MQETGPEAVEDSLSHLSTEPARATQLSADAPERAAATMDALGRNPTDSQVARVLEEPGTGGTLVDGGTGAVPVIEDITHLGTREGIPTVEDDNHD